MNGAAAVADGSRGAFSLDSTVPGAVPRGYDAFRDEWENQVGAAFPLPSFTPATTGGLRARTRVARLHDVAISDIHTASSLQTATPLGDGDDDQVWLHVVRRGAWFLGGLPDRSEQTVSAGQFLLRHVGRPFHFETALHTTTELLVLPSEPLAPLLGNRSITGSADTAEVRLLAAHANMVHATVADLNPAGVHAAHSTLIELAKAVAWQRFDDAEPLLAPALAQAAKELSDRHLADPELTPTMLARELKVSVRTLQRAFATSGESPTAYIRLRRLEEARRALTAQSGRLSISELAVHWQFADTSHFSRAFKKHYGQTPTEYARTNGPV
ncbi:helix-turn-helix domain-containing protein [Streptomyces sp. GQFP]|uniref:helix-turn-helix domain-containing protein n=1 Tax=Streptomyces sp. GQFP TaxID=2907545 RepID=UPI001F1D3CDC|nr:helix-turn-helix domain-containing protein [Streptomyces sp. GQFP]UIX33317.1 helix-turn-helix domain-containing protein [Streptomyces sp. GQFP]